MGCAAVLLVAAAWLPLAFAQGTPAVETVQGSVTSDGPVETATGDIDTNQLPPINASLTTTTQGSQYTSNSAFISSLDQAMFGGLNPQNDAQLLPVTQGLPCDSYTPMTTQIAPALAQTYKAAISNTQQMMTELQNENFSQIANNVQAPAQLAATQGTGQAMLAVVQELQLMRAQMAQLTTVVATNALYQLDATVRPSMPRQGGGC
jgi:hypothetical protein